MKKKVKKLKIKPKQKKFFFCSKKFELEVGECGFSLWTKDKMGLRRWVLDASCLSIDNRLEISFQQNIED